MNLICQKPSRLLKDSYPNPTKTDCLLEQSQKKIFDEERADASRSNQKIGGTNQNLTVAELKAMGIFIAADWGIL
ncbi:MAG: hypothetical protein U5K54_22400 [Cytophagales bacterium]|nr:hypothetical protein [Cytophagales bacterium]